MDIYIFICDCVICRTVDVDINWIFILNANSKPTLRSVQRQISLNQNKVVNLLLVLALVIPNSSMLSLEGKNIVKYARVSSKSHSMWTGDFDLLSFLCENPENILNIFQV